MFDYQCKLVRVVDGDTIDVNIDLGFSVWHKARVRMLGIDTPESRTRNLEEKALGLASKARLKEILKGRQISIECNKEKGKFGRVLATVWAVDKGTGESIDVNTRLIEEGHARPYYGGKKVAWV